MKNLFVILSILFLTIHLFSCKKDDGVKKQTFQKIILDIADAKSLMVVETPVGGSSQNEINFYKIRSDGSFDEVKFINADGSHPDSLITSPVVHVQNFINLNSSFIYLGGSFFVNDTLGHIQFYNALLVRKTDGAIFDFGDEDMPFNYYRLGEKPIKYDALNNMYYSNNSDMVKKLSIDNPKQISKMDYLPAGQHSFSFDIASNGMCMYRYISNLNNFRLKKLDGSIFEILIAGRDTKEFWLGSNGSIYLSSFTWDNGYLPAIHKIIINNNDVSIDNIWSDNTFSYPGVSDMSRLYGQGSYKVEKQGSVLFIDTNGTGYHWEFFESNNTVKNVSLPSIQAGSVIVYNKQYYYIATGTDLYKVDINTHQYIKLLNSGEYQVYSMNVDSNDNLQLNALRLSDGKSVFAEINKDKVFKIVNDQLNKKAIVLERIN